MLCRTFLLHSQYSENIAELKAELFTLYQKKAGKRRTKIDIKYAFDFM